MVTSKIISQTREMAEWVANWCRENGWKHTVNGAIVTAEIPPRDLRLFRFVMDTYPAMKGVTYEVAE